MAVDEKYLADVEEILSHRHDNGGDLWATPDKRLLKGAPFSTLESVSFLTELGMSPEDPVIRDASELIFSTWQKDGRFKVYPQGGIYPCHTINAAEVLCQMGYASDDRMQRTFRHLLEIQYEDGGWRCNKFSFGRGPETERSNPHPTLTALNAFRFSEYFNREPALERAVEFLLEHWTIRKPIGPCHYGIGTLFMQVEYPFVITTSSFTSTSFLSTTVRRKTNGSFRHWMPWNPRLWTDRLWWSASSRSLPSFHSVKKVNQASWRRDGITKSSETLEEANSRLLRVKQRKLCRLFTYRSQRKTEHELQQRSCLNQSLTNTSDTIWTRFELLNLKTCQTSLIISPLSKLVT